jgi:hypothetical protein
MSVRLVHAGTWLKSQCQNKIAICRMSVCMSVRPSVRPSSRPSKDLFRHLISYARYPFLISSSAKSYHRLLKIIEFVVFFTFLGRPDNKGVLQNIFHI